MGILQVIGNAVSTLEPLEAVAERLVRLTESVVGRDLLVRGGPDGPNAVGRGGPLLGVIRNTVTGRIYVGINQNALPAPLAESVGRAIVDQMRRIAAGEVVVVHTEQWALGGHAEVQALNRAELDLGQQLGRIPTEQDRGVLELHIVWLREGLMGEAAPRCEHCLRVTRGVQVTESVFRAEGGVSGEVRVPQRGMVIRAGGGQSEVTSTSGEVAAPQRGMAIRAGGGRSEMTSTSGEVPGPRPGGGVPVTAGAVALGLLDAGIHLVTPAIKRWFAEKYLKEKWDRHYRERVSELVAKFLSFANRFIFPSHLEDIQKAKGAGGEVILHVVVDTEWIQTDLGDAPTDITVSSYSLLFPGDVPKDVWPLFKPRQGFWALLFKAPRMWHTREAFDVQL
jgi:hypothetical protein